MKTATTLLTVSVIIEEEVESTKNVPPMEYEVRQALLAAVEILLRDRPGVQVDWGSSKVIPLDGRTWFGRCAVCNRWVYDHEHPSEFGADGLSRGAMIEGRFRCDEHLPSGHPLCFCGVGYDDPVP